MNCYNYVNVTTASDQSSVTARRTTNSCLPSIHLPPNHCIQTLQKLYFKSQTFNLKINWNLTCPLQWHSLTCLLLASLETFPEPSQFPACDQPTSWSSPQRSPWNLSEYHPTNWNTAQQPRHDFKHQPSQGRQHLTQCMTTMTGAGATCNVHQRQLTGAPAK